MMIGKKHKLGLRTRETHQYWPDNKERHIFFVELEGDIVGSVELIKYIGAEWKVGNLYVDPDHRGSQIGSRLMYIAEGYLAFKNIKRVYLTVDETSWMRQWYRRLGFEDVNPVVPTEEGEVWMFKKVKL